MVCITKTDCRSNDAGWIKVKFKIKFCNEINSMNAKILLKYFLHIYANLLK